MNVSKPVNVTLTALLLAGCGAMSDVTPIDPVTIENPESLPYSVADIDLIVSRSLVVSEQNVYFPGADIVWRQDPEGNRYEQVEAVMMDGLALGTDQIRGERPVDLEIELKRFHSLTERAYSTTGGAHSIFFDLTIRDAETGEIIEGPRLVDAAFVAHGGERALAAAALGNTPKRRIIHHLAGTIQRQLGLDPDSGS